MMTAKAQGKNQVVLYAEEATRRPDTPGIARDVRSIAHLKMLQSLSGKLNRLSDVRAIGEEDVVVRRNEPEHHERDDEQPFERDTRSVTTVPRQTGPSRSGPASAATGRPGSRGLGKSVEDDSMLSRARSARMASCAPPGRARAGRPTARSRRSPIRSARS